MNAILKGPLRTGQPLSPLHLVPLIRKVEEQTAAVKAMIGSGSMGFNVGQFPGPRLPSDLGRFTFHPSLYTGNPYDLFKSAGQFKFTRKLPVVPDPGLLLAEVQQMFANVASAGMGGNIVILDNNLEFWWKEKAELLKDVAREIFSHGHLVTAQEVDFGGLQYTGKSLGYGYWCGPTNRRRQAVGAMAHRRLRLLTKPILLKSMQNIQGIPDMRAGFMLVLRDTISDQVLIVIVVHLKSMIGGPVVTSVIRGQQLANGNEAFKQLLPGILSTLGLKEEDVGIMWVGDFNFPINDPAFHEADALKSEGYKWVAATDIQPTQIMKSRIDGFLIRNVKAGVDYYKTFPYFQRGALKRIITDHATLMLEWLVTTKGSTSNNVINALVGG
jgi:hypothetical protein